MSGSVIARRAVFEHNTLHPDERGGVGPALQALLREFGANARIEAPFHCAYGFNVGLGRDAFINAATTPPAEPSAPAAQSTVVLKPREEIALMRQACGADYRAYCDGARIVGGGALGCLISHASSLSPSCKRVLIRQAGAEILVLWL